MTLSLSKTPAQVYPINAPKKTADIRTLETEIIAGIEAAQGTADDALDAATTGAIPQIGDVTVLVSSVTLSSPGATLDGRSMSVGDRFAYFDPTGVAANAAYGVYVWNGAAVATTRASDANTAVKIGLASVFVVGGTSGLRTFACDQKAADITLGTTALSYSEKENYNGIAGTISAESARAQSVEEDVYPFSKNLYNPNDPGVEDGKYVNYANGLTVANVSYKATGYIPVTAGVTYTASKSGGLAFYTTAKVYISGLTFSIVPPVPCTFTAPADGFVRCSIYKPTAGDDTFQVEVGAAVTAYEPYGRKVPSPKVGVLGADNYGSGSIDLEKTTFGVPSKNLFNIDDPNVAVGYFVSYSNGKLSANSSYVASHYIPVIEGETYTLSYSHQRAFYNASKGYVSGTNSGNPATFTIPAGSGIAFMRVTISNAALASFQCELGSSATAYVPYGHTLSPDVFPEGQADINTLLGRVDKTLDSNGYQKGAQYRPDHIRSARLSLRKLLLATVPDVTESAQTHDFLLIGDSYRQAYNRWTQRFAATLRAIYGDGGPGWIGFGFFGGLTASNNGNVDHVRVTVTYAGSWTSPYLTSNGSPDLGAAVSSTADDTITVGWNGSGNISSVTLYYQAPASAAQIAYSWDAGAHWTNVDLTGTSGTGYRVGLSSVPTGTWSLVLKVNSGTCHLQGLNPIKAGSGIRVHKLGASGSKTTDWLAVDQTMLSAAWASLAGTAPAGGNTVDIGLGTNDQVSLSAATIAANMQALGELALVAIPSADVVLETPPENGLGRSLSMADIAKAVRAVAGAKGWAHDDMQPYFGENYTDYGYSGNTTGRVWFHSDDTHPDTTYGGVVYADAKLRQYLYF